MTEENTAIATLSPDTGDRVAWHRRRRARIGGIVLLAVLLVGGLGFVVPARWLGQVVPGHSVVDDGAVAFRPGSARLVSEAVDVAGIELFQPDGEILFTTVAIDDTLSVWEWVEANVDDAIELRTRESVFGDLTESETRERNLQLMQSSKDTAVVVALEHLGIEVLEATGIGFQEVVEGGPAAGRLRTGDVIVDIDGDPVTDLESLRAILDRHGSGDEIALLLEDAETGESRRESLVLGVHPEGGGAFIGIGGVQERVIDIPLPFDIAIDSGSIGGPSAGLAFTLSILDLLTPGELTGGSRVAATGTIALDGSVGNVGGVAQKAAAASDRGVDLFIVPEASVEAARSTAGSMRVVGVVSLEAALEALADLGGQTSELALPGDSLDS